MNGYGVRRQAKRDAAFSFETGSDNFVGVHIRSLFDCETEQKWGGFGSG
jgi:hypothetical protein